jgi:hypothetical protein
MQAFYLKDSFKRSRDLAGARRYLVRLPGFMQRDIAGADKRARVH